MTEADIRMACKRELSSIVRNKRIRKRLDHLIRKYGKERVESLAIELAGFRN